MNRYILLGKSNTLGVISGGILILLAGCQKQVFPTSLNSLSSSSSSVGSNHPVSTPTPTSAPTPTPTATPVLTPTPIPTPVPTPRPTPVPTPVSSTPEAQKVLVVYNDKWEGDEDRNGVNDSLQVAKYYMGKRGVPDKNLLAIHSSIRGNSVYGYYNVSAPENTLFNEIVAPIKAKLQDLGPTNIDIILLSYGVPIMLQDKFTFSVDNMLMGINFWDSTFSNGYSQLNPYNGAAPTFNPDKPHFDHSLFKYNGKEMYLVSRIDGPRNVVGAMELVDQALYGERFISPKDGYFNGTVYVNSHHYTDQATLAADHDVKSGNYVSIDTTDKNISYSAYLAAPFGFPIKWGVGNNIGSSGTYYTDSTPALQAPRALFFAGWYGMQNDSTEATPRNVYEWLPGSVADNLISDSLRDLRNYGELSESLRRGLSCASGVVAEPYTAGHPQPNVLLYYMLKGYSFAEAGGLAAPWIGWMPINVGDPLYTPMGLKPLVKDIYPPTLASDYPFMVPALDIGGIAFVIKLMVNDSPEPEVVRAQVDYGITTAYGNTAYSDYGFWKRPDVHILGLQPDTVYHYRVRLTDPVGNVTTTGDYNFSTSLAHFPQGRFHIKDGATYYSDGAYYSDGLGHACVYTFNDFLADVGHGDVEKNLLLDAFPAGVKNVGACKPGNMTTLGP